MDTDPALVKLISTTNDSPSVSDLLSIIIYQTLLFVELKNLLTQLFAMDPADRPSLKKIAKHPW